MFNFQEVCTFYNYSGKSESCILGFRDNLLFKMLINKTIKQDHKLMAFSLDFSYFILATYHMAALCNNSQSDSSFWLERQSTDPLPELLVVKKAMDE